MAYLGSRGSSGVRTPMKTSTCVWVGASGRQYSFSVFALPVSLNAGQAGNYIYTRLNQSGQWVPIYIGEGELNDRANNHHQAACLRAKGATHFHCHLNSVQQARRVEEMDLLARYTNAYAPNGCNERLGG